MEDSVKERASKPGLMDRRSWENSTATRPTGTECTKQNKASTSENGKTTSHTEQEQRLVQMVQCTRASSSMVTRKGKANLPSQIKLSTTVPSRRANSTGSALTLGLMAGSTLALGKTTRWTARVGWNGLTEWSTKVSIPTIKNTEKESLPGAVTKSTSENGRKENRQASANYTLGTKFKKASGKKGSLSLSKPRRTNQLNKIVGSIHRQHAVNNGSQDILSNKRPSSARFVATAKRSVSYTRSLFRFSGNNQLNKGVWGLGFGVWGLGFGD